MFLCLLVCSAQGRSADSSERPHRDSAADPPSTDHPHGAGHGNVRLSVFTPDIHARINSWILVRFSVELCFSSAQQKCELTCHQGFNIHYKSWILHYSRNWTLFCLMSLSRKPKKQSSFERPVCCPAPGLFVFPLRADFCLKKKPSSLSKCEPDCSYMLYTPATLPAVRNVGNHLGR